MGITYEEVDEFSKRWDSTIARLKAEFPSEWSITGYKGHGTYDGVAWVASLRLNGKRVGQLEDQGVGGSVFVYFLAPEQRDRNRDRDRWEADVKAALPDEKIEPDQMVIEALLQRAGK